MRFSKRDFARWQEVIDTSELTESEKQQLRDYVFELMRREVPPIVSARHLSLLLGIEHSVLRRILTTSEQFYRPYDIPKRAGGVRRILIPSPVLQHAQRWILKNILESVPLSDSAHGFVRDRSIVSFATPHLDKASLLHVDVADFFPSINFAAIKSIFRNLGYSHRISTCLANICSTEGALPQGAPSSPAISNIFATQIDRRLSGLANELDLSYTRYADNIVLSGNYISPKLIKTIAQILLEHGLQLNKSKTYLSTTKSKRIIAGLSVSGAQLRLPKQARRQLRLEAFFLLTRGFKEHTKAIGVLDPIYMERLIGRMEYWCFVEPHNQHARQALNGIRRLSNKL